ncbi:ABC transporter permease [Mycobacterium sp. CVI_P3]|uniref:ABC transporter permease n=1 Tax=Mycobacterium pinniadriaticum TaxID=2994102 RepID=A0ABT3SBK2_9MYCO|nr:ABC transporter permease [Mycobacterium pinniadriaticum]MCX2930482.1 ABC transporter permease [Mycobacterium pinniadriaticum]MCX2936906.1 ABC transporter permease [Mycobacterium pinniadriaticum]
MVASLPAESAGDLPARASVLRRLVAGNRQTLLGLCVLGVFAAIAVLAPVIATAGINTQFANGFAAPSAAHPLGLDGGGFDVLTRLVHGARTSLLVGSVAALVGMVIGGVIGVLAGYFGGRTDGLLMRTTDYFLVIPDIPLMIVAAAVFGQNLTNIVIVIGLVYWASTARLIRAQVLSVRQRTFVHRVEAMGAAPLWVLARHVVPHVMPLLVANTVLMVANAIFAETYISFLGLGDPSVTSWGRMIQEALDQGAVLAGAWWVVLPPGLAVTIVVLAATVAGQGMEDTLNPRLKVGHLAVRRFRVRPLHGRLERA